MNSLKCIRTTTYLLLTATAANAQSTLDIMAGPFAYDLSGTGKAGFVSIGLRLAESSPIAGGVRVTGTRYTPSFGGVRWLNSVEAFGILRPVGGQLSPTLSLGLGGTITLGGTVTDRLVETATLGIGIDYRVQEFDSVFLEIRARGVDGIESFFSGSGVEVGGGVRIGM